MKSEPVSHLATDKNAVDPRRRTSETPHRARGTIAPGQHDLPRPATSDKGASGGPLHRYGGAWLRDHNGPPRRATRDGAPCQGPEPLFFFSCGRWTGRTGMPSEANSVTRLDRPGGGGRAMLPRRSLVRCSRSRSRPLEGTASPAATADNTRGTASTGREARAREACATSCSLGGLCLPCRSLRVAWTGGRGRAGQGKDSTHSRCSVHRSSVYRLARRVLESDAPHVKTSATSTKPSKDPHGTVWQDYAFAPRQQSKEQSLDADEERRTGTESSRANHRATNRRLSPIRSDSIELPPPTHPIPHPRGRLRHLPDPSPPATTRGASKQASTRQRRGRRRGGGALACVRREASFSTAALAALSRSISAACSLCMASSCAVVAVRSRRSSFSFISARTLPCFSIASVSLACTGITRGDQISR